MSMKKITKGVLSRSLAEHDKKLGFTELKKAKESNSKLLQGLLNEIDDNYLSHEEQGTAINLQNSGEGLAIINSIEGNTLKNLFSGKKEDLYGVSSIEQKENGYMVLKQRRYGDCIHTDISNYKPNTTYTLIVDVKTNSVPVSLNLQSDPRTIVETYDVNPSINPKATGIYKYRFRTRSAFNDLKWGFYFQYAQADNNPLGDVELRFILLEGDYINKEIPEYFENMLSVFENKLDQTNNKYKVDLKLNNKNIFNEESFVSETKAYSNYVTVEKYDNRRCWHSVNHWAIYQKRFLKGIFKKNVQYHIKYQTKQVLASENELGGCYVGIRYTDGNRQFVSMPDSINKWGDAVLISYANKTIDYITFTYGAGSANTYIDLDSFQIIEANGAEQPYIKPAYNTINFYINEPLRASEKVSDKLIIKDGRVQIERNTYLLKFKDENVNEWSISVIPHSEMPGIYNCYIMNNVRINDTIMGEYHNRQYDTGICNKFTYYKYVHYSSTDYEHLTSYGDSTAEFVAVLKKDKLPDDTKESYFNYLQTNDVQIIIRRKEPIYEDLDPQVSQMLLDCYDNGTLYINTLIPPSNTSVKYTPYAPVLQNLRLNVINNDNIKYDIDGYIVPQFMDMDFQLLQLEQKLANKTGNISVKANLTVEEETDMMNAQERTYEMLRRDIKSKRLTYDQAVTRITAYFDAGRITKEHEQELMLFAAEQLK